jgi:hypothetical protein
LREEFSGSASPELRLILLIIMAQGHLIALFKDSLKITYLSVDLLKNIEAAQPGRARPSILIGVLGAQLILKRLLSYF